MLMYNNQIANNLYYGSQKVLAAYIGSRRIYRGREDLPFENGAEPEGDKFYFTPDGAGDADGTSWANAYPISSINAALLTHTSGNYYFASGNYTTSWPMAVPENVNLFGGFNGDKSWSSRNSFTHPTQFTGTGAFVAKTGSDYRALDGFTLVGYSSIGMNAKNLTIGDNSDITVKKLNNCICSNSTITSDNCDINDCNFTSCALTGVANISYSNIINQTNKNLAISGDASYCYFSKCSGARNTLSNGIINGNAESCSIANCSNTGVVNAYIISGNATNCTISDCSCSCSNSGSNAYIISGNATNCTISDCSCTSVVSDRLDTANAYIISGNATNCTISDCSCTSTTTNYYGKTYAYIISGDASSCSISDCSCTNTGNSFVTTCSTYIISGDASSCSITNCNSTYVISGDALSCIITNCSGNVISGDALSCTITNCNSSIVISGYTRNSQILNCTGRIGSTNNTLTHNTIANCTISNYYGRYYNNILFNNSADLSPKAGTGNAQSSYHANNAITLGTDNSLAKFVDLGTIDAVGYQEDLTCPNPITDRAGFDSFVASFGDWHLQPTSFLAGAGVYDEDITADKDGVTRPNPPTIGAYEPNQN